ncbi:MAG: NADH-quinone oxidoreductase subunit [Candidatus Sumerlaeota bacterium]|nr:NADH-quinone oxidoreductase subunit [Candidatus Sumerlaeota bacterium]
MPTLESLIETLQSWHLDFVQFAGGFVGGPENVLVLLFAFAKIGLVLAHVLGFIPLIVYGERRIIGLVQDRPGPNRVGPFGLLQGIVDGVKLLLKEDFIPAHADRTLYLIAPGLVLVPAFLAMCIIPFGPVIDGEALLALYTMLGLESLYTPSSTLPLAITNPNIGILYVFAMTSVAVYGITLAGWSSENKWSLLGGIRASAQMISYEISMSLSIIGVLLIVGSLNLYDIVGSQESIWHWNVFAQPVGFLLFLTAIFAETNRLPFDLAEGESELTGGFHTEYSSMKFALFFMAEYANMITASAICVTLFLGGYHLIPAEFVEGIIAWVLNFISSSEAGIPILPGTAALLASALAPLGIAIKIGALLVLFIMTRAIWPRMRYDQVMNLGWKLMLVAGLLNLLITAITVGVLAGIGARRAPSPADVGASIDAAIQNGKIVLFFITGGLLLLVDRWYARRRRRKLAAAYPYFGRSIGKTAGAASP